MKVTVIGPICKDEIIMKGKSHFQSGGVTYYTGEALASLGVDVTILGSFGDEKKDWLSNWKCKKIVHIKKEDTIKFINVYPEKNPDIRIQKAHIAPNQIRIQDIQEETVNDANFIILGPLFHDNLDQALVEKLSKYAPLVLAPQGLIRYLDGEKIVWKNRENVLRLLPYIEYLFLNEEELRFISDQEGVQEGAAFLQKKGAKNVIATLGQRGSWLFLGHKEYKIKAFPSKELVDPTGAGDSYMAGFIQALSLFKDPIKQGEFAAMTATITIENKGPSNASQGEVIQRLD
ncbi:MAG: PfkB family carbohydrate kinase [Nanoarchaeota archaeon]